MNFKILIRKLESILRFLPDETYLKLKYRYKMKRKLNLDNPQTFNEKIQWLKIHDRKNIYTKLVDKYEVKKIVGEIIGEEYIIPTLGVWNRFDDIEFDKLPDTFVLKCTHDSGGLYICNDSTKFDIEQAREIITSSLKHNFYWSGREWPYKNVKPRIIAEEYLETDDLKCLVDYKLMCFNGKVKCIFVCSERYSSSGLKVTFFSRDWIKLPFERYYPMSQLEIEKPKNYNKMIELAEKLAKEISFVRIDFYEVLGEIYFGEMTFFPGSGWEKFKPNKWDYKLGSWIKLPERG